MDKHEMGGTIAAIATPVGEGGIGIVRLSGGRALSIADKIFVSKNGKRPSEFDSYTVKYGHIVDKGKEGKRRDEKGEQVSGLDLLFERDEILSSRQARRIKFHRVENNIKLI